MPSDERAFLRSQAVRRLRLAGLLVLLGAMIAATFLSGMEARATALGERGQNAGHPPPDDADKRFFRLYSAYWIAIIGLVFALFLLAILDGWAARRYWLRAYRRLRDDYNAKLQRDLAVYRQQKMQDRETRLRRGLGEGE